MREGLDRQLRSVQDDLLRMGSRVEYAFALAIDSLTSWDRTLAQQVISQDGIIDIAYTQLEEAVFHLLATQQPIIGRDLRLLHAALTIASELERMGDYAKGIARCVLSCLRAPMLLAPPPELLAMARLAQQMLKIATDTLVRLDAVQARSLASLDEEVDQFDDAVEDALVKLARSDTRHIEAVMALRDIAHRLERLADRTTNIAERVIFIVTSQTEVLNAS